jgi:CRP-like cAMP-binding protein
MASPTANELKRLPLFAALAGSDRDFLAKNLDEMSFGPGEKLIAEGRSNHTFFVLLEGEVEVSVEGAPRSRLGPGEFFGEISMDQHVPATATVRSKTPVRAYVMSHTQFRVLKANDAIMLALRTSMIERLVKTRQP